MYVLALINLCSTKAVVYSASRKVNLLTELRCAWKTEKVLKCNSRNLTLGKRREATLYTCLLTVEPNVLDDGQMCHYICCVLLNARS